jgi:hypothetical protein
MRQARFDSPFDNGLTTVKIALWLVMALLVLLWTAGAALAAGVTDWAAGLIASGQAIELGTSAAQIPVPQWIALWVDPALVQATQQAVLWTLTTFRDSLPWVAAMIGWLVPLIWIAWGLGLLALLAVAAGGHLLIGRFAGTRARAFPAT